MTLYDILQNFMPQSIESLLLCLPSPEIKFYYAQKHFLLVFEK